MRGFGKLIKDDRGATAVEYALILALVFIAMIAGVQAFASATTGMWNRVSSEVESAR